MGRNRKLWTYSVDLETKPLWIIALLEDDVERFRMGVLADTEELALGVAKQRYPDYDAIGQGRLHRCKIDTSYGPIN